MKFNLGKILQKQRLVKKKATLRELANDAGVSNAYLCQLEQSEDRLLQISWLNLQRVARAYGIPLDELELRMRVVAESTGLLKYKLPGE